MSSWRLPTALRLSQHQLLAAQVNSIIVVAFSLKEGKVLSRVLSRVCFQEFLDLARFLHRFFSDCAPMTDDAHLKKFFSLSHLAS